MLLGDLEVGRWGQRRAADVLLDARIPAVDLVVACRGSPRRRARPRARRLPCTCLGCFHLGFVLFTSGITLDPYSIPKSLKFIKTANLKIGAPGR